MNWERREDNDVGRWARWEGSKVASFERVGG